MKRPERSRSSRSGTFVALSATLRAFSFAFEGIVHATRTQVNMRMHWIAAALVLAATLYFRLERPYAIGIIICVAMVLSFELLNTSIEAVVDLMVEVNHPLAKIAKDTAAGAVLVAACGAFSVGCLTFYEGIVAGGDRVYRAASALQPVALWLALVVVALLLIARRGLAARGSVIRGGTVSAYAAFSFAAATFVALLSHSALLAALGVFLALLVAQSRLESGIHSVREVVFGGLLGAGVSYGVWALAALPVVL